MAHQAKPLKKLEKMKKNRTVLGELGLIMRPNNI